MNTFKKLNKFYFKMMKSTFTLFFVLTYFFANGQEINGNIKNHEKADMDLVLMLFGMDTPISIGSVDKKGQFTANLENISLDQIPEENRSMSIGPLYFNFHFNCNSPEAFGGNAEKPAARQRRSSIQRN